MLNEQSLLELFDDLERQADGLAIASREAEVAELAVAHYAEIDLGARLHASVGREVNAQLGAGIRVVGELARVGADWVLIRGGNTEWAVQVDSMLLITGLSPDADKLSGTDVLAKLRFASVLRRLAQERTMCALFLRDGQQQNCHIARVGSDFVEVSSGERGRSTVVALAHISAIRMQP